MKLVTISDTHGRHHELRIPSGDLLIHAGDWSPKSGTQDSIGEFDRWLRRLPIQQPPILSPGNHDYYLEEDDARAYWTPSAIVLIDRLEVIEGLRVWGSPVTPLWGGAFGLHKPEDRARRYAQIPTGLDILITHGPPYGVMDHLPGESSHNGCPELLAAVLRAKPRLHIFGHVHGAYGTQTTPDTTFINAASLRPDGSLNSPIVIDIQPSTHSEIFALKVTSGPLKVACLADVGVETEVSAATRTGSNTDVGIVAALEQAMLRQGSGSFSRSSALLSQVFAAYPGFHPSWDPSSIRYFSPAEFAGVVRECTAIGVEIYGIEIFTRQGKLVGIFHSKKDDNQWASNLALRCQLTSDRLIMSATYGASGSKMQSQDSLLCGQFIEAGGVRKACWRCSKSGICGECKGSGAGGGYRSPGSRIGYPVCLQCRASGVCSFCGGRGAR